MRSVQVLCINEVIATKKVTEKVKKWWKIAILWLFLSHRGCHMAPRPQKHEYLLATMFCTKFEHFRMSGSIICTQLFLSLTRCFKGTSFFQISNSTNNILVRNFFVPHLVIKYFLSLQLFVFSALWSPQPFKLPSCLVSKLFGPPKMSLVLLPPGAW